jgi:small-conductance mechanosensitive channel
MKKAVLNYGLISGAISAVLMVCVALLADKGNFEASMWIGYSCMVLAFLVIYPGMASYRDGAGGGTISYWRALSIGLLITAISCTCYVIAWIFVYHTMFPDFLEKYAAHVLEAMKKRGSSAAEMNKALEEMKHYREMYQNPVTMFLITFIEPLPVGILISLIAAFVVRMKKKS